MKHDDIGNAEGDEPIVDEVVDTPEQQATVAQESAVSEDRMAAAITAERDKYLRLAAEFDNYRKRMVKERQEAGAKAQADVVNGLLEPIDDLMRFSDLDPASVDSATLVQGVDMVEKKILKTLAGHGLEVVDPAGRIFDPAFHEAISTEPAASAEEDDIVSRVFQLGYVFRGQLLRPARVVVKQWPG